jgi:Lon protease-like protein
MEEIKRVPLFPLGVVLLPQMKLQLHIFEQRYKTMIVECLEEEKDFGIVYYDGSDIKSIGCMAHIQQVLKRYDDGRMDILTSGTTRFEIKKIYQEKTFLEADVLYFDDDDVEDVPVQSNVSEKAQALLLEVATITKQNPEDILPDSSNLQSLSFIIAAVNGFTNEEKQKFLEMHSVAHRINKGIEALEQIIERIKINQKIKNIVSGNGHLPELFK